MSAPVAGPGPVARSDDSAAFFDAAAGGRFVLSRCPSGHWGRPQTRRCHRCGSDRLALEPASGRARLVSWAVVHPRPGEASDPAPVRVPAIVELDEGPWWWTQLVDVDLAALAEGTPLQVVFERPAGSETIPVFTARTGS